MTRDADADRRARRLAWIAIAYLLSSILLLLVVMGGSQALKNEFIGDTISLIPPILFLVGGRVSSKKATEMYPFGFARAVTAGYLGAALALLAVGLFLLGDSARKLILLEHPTIGGINLFGHVIWLGWLAFPVLAWSSIPAFFLGRAKTRLAEDLNDKVLLADARVNEADWQSAGAAMIGVLGIAFGLWWLDAAAALFISIEIIRDGFTEVRLAIGDIVDRRPVKLVSQELDPLPETLTAFLKGKPWIEDAVVRLRENGRRFTGEAIIVPRQDAQLVAHLAEATREAIDSDDRLQSFHISPLPEIPEELQRVRADRSDGNHPGEEI